MELKLQQLRGYLEVAKKEKRIAEVQGLMESPGFWQDNQAANKLVQELKNLKATFEPWRDCQRKFLELKEFAQISSQDEGLLNQIKQDLDKLSHEIDGLEFQTLLSGQFDKCSAILSINAGAGGTESCDWVGMLLRMYIRWAESKKYKVETTDILSGEEAGVKNVTIRVLGQFAYGYLKSENGVHRLVRISPFDSNKRRHTSFASVDVIPEVEEDAEVQIKPEEMRIDVFRSSGPGGQSVNTTDSAIRITHIPTGIVVACQNERSQYQNKQTALKILKARLYELKLKEQEEKLSQNYAEKRRIEWGSQVRSYVLHPYNMVKDHRTEVETGNSQKVLDGDIDMFIEAFLKIMEKKN
ncbi:MAG: peptide chain release factor 2 [Candidatus Omnitrophota bacterium]|nr:peptide chain release factor 2 [Candidatus Omnitrophota bacterium]